MIKDYKITKRRTLKIMPNGKVKRQGDSYEYEVAYFTNFWHFKTFPTLKEAKDFINA